ncbi:MAG: CHAD domain-containing protein [Marinobacterium sp.]|nr:CHAD domain-containing protein [Marinobacterium sp.]
MRWKQQIEAPDMMAMRGLEEPLKRLQRALTHRPLDDRSVHQVRLQLKQVSALLRLIQHQLPAERYRKAKEATRQLAHNFDDAREYRVLRETLRSLLKAPALSATRARILRVMEERTPHALPGHQRLIDDQQRLKLALAAVRPAKGAADKSGIDREGHESMSVRSPEYGLKRSYRRCRRQWLKIRHRPEPEALHRWRRAVKQLQYQLQTLVPGQHRRYQARVQQLALLLGELHDLHDLELWQQLHSRWLWLEERQCIQSHIRARETKLIRRIMVLGERLYRQPPATFCRWQQVG